MRGRYITEWRVKLRRTLVDVDNDRNAYFIDSMMNQEAVKLNSNEQYELERFDDYLIKIQDTALQVGAWTHEGHGCTGQASTCPRRRRRGANHRSLRRGCGCGELTMFVPACAEHQVDCLPELRAVARLQHRPHRHDAALRAQGEAPPTIGTHTKPWPSQASWCDNHLWLAASAVQVMRGVMSVGEVVAINGLLLQLSVPFNFIGYTYQELRQVLRDKANAPVIGQAPLLTPC